MKWALIGLAGLILIVVVVGAALPSTVERSIVIDATPQDILVDVTDVRTWRQWTYWSERNDPDYKPEYDGPASMKWASFHDSAGSLKLTHVEQSGVTYEVDIVDGPAFEGAIRVAPQEKDTLVTWSSSSEGLGLMAGVVAAAMRSQLDENLAP